MAINTLFWNLQNLFGAEPNDIATDLEFTPETGWDQATVDAKLESLAGVLRELPPEKTPHVFGVCEVENEDLLRQLLSLSGLEHLAIAHDESSDLRGIDCALAYDPAVLEPAGPPVGHLAHLRFRTRDIFQVPLRVKENNAPLDVFVVHFPSRRGGAMESEAFRITIAAHLGRLVDDVLKVSRNEFLSLPATQASVDMLENRWNANVLVMGDVNDEPFDRSIKDVLQAGASFDKLEEALKLKPEGLPEKAASYLRKQAYLYNAAWPLLGDQGAGTLFFDDGSPRTKQLFDQFLASRGLTLGLSGLRLGSPRMEIFAPRSMWTNSSLAGPEARPHMVRPKGWRLNRSQNRWQPGVSDHFPVLLPLEVV